MFTKDDYIRIYLSKYSRSVSNKNQFNRMNSIL